MAKKKNTGHSNFMGKVHGVMKSTGYSESRARRIVGAMVRDAKELAGRLTKKKKAARARVMKAAHELHGTLFK